LRFSFISSLELKTLRRRRVPAWAQSGEEALRWQPN
jgi:hypothetical protein